MTRTTFHVGRTNPPNALRVTNELPVDFLEPYVQTVHTAERDILRFFRNLLLGERSTVVPLGFPVM